MRAARGHPFRRWLEDRHELGFVVALVKAAAAVTHALAGERTRDEYGFAGAGTLVDIHAADHAFAFVCQIDHDARFQRATSFRTTVRAQGLALFHFKGT